MKSLQLIHITTAIIALGSSIVAVPLENSSSPNAEQQVSNENSDSVPSVNVTKPVEASNQTDKDKMEASSSNIESSYVVKNLN